MALIQALYGTDEASLRWNELINNILTKKIGLNRCLTDACVYYYRNGKDKLVVTLFVDDLYIRASSKKVMEEFNERFAKEFPEHSSHTETKLNYLGMSIEYDPTTKKTYIDQFDYIDKIIKKYRISKESRFPSSMNLFDESEEDK